MKFEGIDKTADDEQGEDARAEGVTVELPAGGEYPTIQGAKLELGAEQPRATGTVPKAGGA